MATEHDNDQPASPWSRTSVQLSALFVLMLLVIGIAIAIFHHGSQHAHAGNAPATSQAGTPPATTTTPAAATGPCSLPAGDQQVPSASYPQGTTWQRRRHDEHPPIVHSWPAARPERDQRVLCAQPGRCAPGRHEPDGEGTTNISRAPGVRQLAINVPSAVTTAAGGPRCDPACRSPATSTTAIRGRAPVEVALRHAEGGLSVIQAPMRWTGNDWKYVFPPEGPDLKHSERCAG